MSSIGVGQRIGQVRPKVVTAVTTSTVVNLDFSIAANSGYIVFVIGLAS